MNNWTEKDFQLAMVAQFMRLAGLESEKVAMFDYMITQGFRPFEANHFGDTEHQYKLVSDAAKYDALKKKGLVK